MGRVQKDEMNDVQSFLVDALTVEIHPSVERLAASAAGTAAGQLRLALARQPYAAVILASAASQVQFLERLVVSEDIDWSRVTLFHMDEYLGISDSHDASFRRFLRERVEQRVRPRTFHYLAGEADQPLIECERYTALLRAQPIDLCCLGIGENGHVAFNDPPVADFDDPHTVKIVKLDAACRQQQVGEGAFPSFDAVPQYAYTLTVPALCAARKLVCVVPEQRKAQAVRLALTGPIHTACPASVLRRQPHATLFLDRDSASQLSPHPASLSPRLDLD
jgi:glucosamine-6-phosphate deaminase